MNLFHLVTPSPIKYVCNYVYIDRKPSMLDRARSLLHSRLLHSRFRSRKIHASYRFAIAWAKNLAVKDGQFIALEFSRRIPRHGIDPFFVTTDKLFSYRFEEKYWECALALANGQMKSHCLSFLCSCFVLIVCVSVCFQKKINAGNLGAFLVFSIKRYPTEAILSR